MNKFAEGRYAPRSSRIESVDNALQLLVLLHERSEIRVTDVSDTLKVARSTAHRLLSTMAWRGFVIQDRASKTYRAGHALFAMGFTSSHDHEVWSEARLHMERLSELCRETVNLIVLERGGCRFIDGIEGTQPVRIDARTGTLLPAYATSGGKVLLADLSSEELREIYPNGLRRVTENTMTRFARLESDLESVRQRGYAVNFGESDPKLHAIAVPIKGASGSVVAALAISTPAHRMGSARIPEFVRQLEDCAAAISAGLK